MGLRPIISKNSCSKTARQIAARGVTQPPQRFLDQESSETKNLLRRHKCKLNHPDIFLIYPRGLDLAGQLGANLTICIYLDGLDFAGRLRSD